MRIIDHLRSGHADWIDIGLHCAGTLAAVAPVAYFLGPWGVFDVGLAATTFWLARELHQHGWSFANMGPQSQAEWIIPGLLAGVLSVTAFLFL